MSYRNERGSMPIVIGAALAVLSVLFGWVLSTSGATPLVGAIGLFGLCIVVFRMRESLLPVFLILVLAMGSAYDYRISAKSYYPRFIILGLIALRSTLLTMQAKGQTGQHSYPLTPVHIGFLLTGVAGLATSLDSVDPMLSFQRSVSFLLLYIVSFFYFWNWTSSVERCEKLAESLWWTVAIILGTGYLFFVARVPGMYKGGRLRLVLTNPNQLGHYCALMFPIAFWYWREHASGKKKYAAAALLGLMALALLLSGSRGGLLCTTVAMLVLFIFCYRKQLVRLLLVVTLVGCVQLLIGKSNDLNSQGGFFEETVLREGALSTGSGRTDIWKAALRLIDREPFFGYGFGTVEKLFDRGYFPEFPTFQGGHVHNSYLEELVNLGWIGSLGLFLAIIFLFGKGVFAVFKSVSLTPNFRLFTAFFASVLAALISGIFESWFTSVGSIFCFPFTLIAVTMLKMRIHFNNWSK
jgi:O-antigen ligase